MSPHGRPEGLILERTARKVHMLAHGRSEGLIPQRMARRISE
ncbi:hypothetical protein [Rhodoferax sp. BAB1]|nr:hypothetical protein [Rhodoferax sp. BAB1]